MGYPGNGPPQAHVLEATVEGLKLSLGELGPSLQLLQPLGLVPDRRELHVGIDAVFQERPPGKDRPLETPPLLNPPPVPQTQRLGGARNTAGVASQRVSHIPKAQKIPEPPFGHCCSRPAQRKVINK